MPTNPRKEVYRTSLQIQKKLYLIYPVIVVFGQLVSFFLLHDGKNIDPELSNYNSRPSVLKFRRSIFNVYFVKLGWLWTTVSISLILLIVLVYLALFGAQNSDNSRYTNVELQDININIELDDSGSSTSSSAEVTSESSSNRIITEVITTETLITKLESSKYFSAFGFIRLIFGFIIRYCLATLWWIFYAQWFFGLPIMDRIFLATGGSCKIGLNDSNYSIISKVLTDSINLNPLKDLEIQKIGTSEFSLDQIISSKSNEIISALLSNRRLLKSSNLTDSILQSDLSLHSIPALAPLSPIFKDSTILELSASSSTCRAIKGHWLNGHDPSGHTFLLVHMSLYILFELLPFLISFMNNDNVKRKASINSPRNNIIIFTIQATVLLILSLQIIWLWMIGITSIYFHSFFEKILGLIFGYLGIVIIYNGFNNIFGFRNNFISNLINYPYL